jgi:chromosome segregation ATPase
MQSVKKKMLIWFLIVAAFGLSGYVGYCAYQFRLERDQLAQKLEEEIHKFKLLKRKYAEEKSLAASLRRAKLAVEGQLAKAHQELAAVQEEKTALMGEMESLESKYARKTKVLETKIGKYAERVEKLLKIQEQYKTKLSEAVKTARERHAAILKLEAEKENLSGELQRTVSELKRCVKHNVALGKIAEELVVAYKEKGVGDSLTQAEPFTQIKKVEVERIVQEYLDRIDSHNLEIIKQ